MTRGTYIRSDDIRKKQSQSQKKRLKEQEVDYNTITDKRNATMTANGTTSGRRKSLVPVVKVCEHCSNVFEATTSYAIKHAKFCGNRCYFASKKGTRPLVPDEILKAPRPYRPRYHMRNPRLREYIRYRNEVKRISEKVYVQHMDTINPGRKPRTLCGVHGGWQLDHIYPLKRCFEEGWSPEQAGCLSNLQMLPWEENLRKRDKVDSF